MFDQLFTLVGWILHPGGSLGCCLACGFIPYQVRYTRGEGGDARIVDQSDIQMHSDESLCVCQRIKVMLLCVYNKVISLTLFYR